MRKINRSVTIFILIFVYKLLLDFALATFIAKEYAYVGGALDFNGFKFLMSNIYLLAIYLVLPKTSEKPSFIFLQMHLFVMIIPMLSLYGMQNQSSIFISVIVTLYCMECFILREAKVIKIYRIQHSKRILVFLLSAISIFVYASMIKANGIPSLAALNFWHVYSIRSGVVYPFLMGYLVHWQAKVINPFLITLGYVKKKRSLLVGGFGMQLLLYLITAQKSFILIPIAILFITIGIEKFDMLKVTAVFSGLGVSSALILYKVTGSIMLAFLFIYRLLFLPAQIKYYYYDFFSVNKLIYFSEGVLGKIFRTQYPYDLKMVNMISDIYYHDPLSRANTGYFADAYANGGLMAMLVISLVLVLALLLIDSLTSKMGKNVVVGLCIFSMLSLNDIGLLTTLLTGGLLFLIILLYLENNSDLENTPSKE